MRQRRAAAFTALAAAAACRPTANGGCARDSDCRTDALCAPWWSYALAAAPHRGGRMPLRWTWLVLLAVACATAKPRGAILEPESSAVAEGDSSEPRRYASARAYRHYLDALLARNSDDFATAASELREALLYDPESPHLHSVLAEVLLKQGRLADAEEELQIALALDPGHAPARMVSVAASRRSSTLKAPDFLPSRMKPPT